MPYLNYIWKLAVAGALTLLGPAVSDAYTATSPNYRLDSAAMDSLGGDAASGEYQLTASGGEAFVGAAAGTTYSFNAGFVATLEKSITLTLDSLLVTIPPVTPGASQTATSAVTVRTDAAGYYLSARQDHDLQSLDGQQTIPAVAGSIATPALWTEGTTTGFGFSLISGTGLDAKWGTNPNYKYAAFPGTSTVIHTKPNYTDSNDVTTVQYRLDVGATQAATGYRNTVTYNATVRP